MQQPAAGQRPAHVFDTRGVELVVIERHHTAPLHVGALADAAAKIAAHESAYVFCLRLHLLSHGAELGGGLSGVNAVGEACPEFIPCQLLVAPGALEAVFRRGYAKFSVFVHDLCCFSCSSGGFHPSGECSVKDR